jgi:hypothetical protein
VNTDEKRKKRFLRGVHPYLRMQLRMLKATEFQELLDASITMEDDFKLGRCVAPRFIALRCL